MKRAIAAASIAALGCLAIGGGGAQAKTPAHASCPTIGNVSVPGRATTVSFSRVRAHRATCAFAKKKLLAFANSCAASIPVPPENTKAAACAAAGGRFLVQPVTEGTTVGVIYLAPSGKGLTAVINL